jgi:hypothetical protein
VKISKLTFKRQIGLYLWILIASWHFGRSVMILKLREKNGMIVKVNLLQV